MPAAVGLHKYFSFVFVCLLFSIIALQAETVEHSSGVANNRFSSPSPPLLVHRIYPSQLELGNSREEVESAFSDAQRINTRVFQRRYRHIVGDWENKFLVIVWYLSPSNLDTILSSESQSSYMIAFIDSAGTLADLLAFYPERRERTVPYIRGAYYKGLQSVEVGMSIVDVFSNVGEVPPVRYWRESEEDWLIEFLYVGMEGESWSVVVNAATGSVVRIDVSGV